MMKKVMLGAVSTVALFAPTMALALPEVLVTAERRAENLQSVPIAVSAFDASLIDRLQIGDVKDIGENVPNLQTYTLTANASAFQVHMRGASVQNAGLNTSESPVGIYEDDIYRGRLATANLELTDIERIEVLRGPQGTLYGRNTVAGAVKLISRTPGDEFWANGSLGYGSFETSKVAASIGGPLQEGQLAASAAFVYHNRDEGYFNNPTLGTEPGEYENWAGRAKLHFYGSDDWDVVATIWGNSSDNDGYNGVPYGPVTGTADGSVAPSVPGVPAGGFYDTFTAIPDSGDSEQWGTNVNVTWDINDAVTLKSITGYTDINDEFNFDLNGGIRGFGSGLIITSDSDHEQFSQELQLLGTAMDDRLDWLLGVYYLDEEGSQTFGGNISFAPPSLIPLFTEMTENSTESISVFGQLTYDITDRLAITGGVRWTQDDKDFDYMVAFPDDPTTPLVDESALITNPTLDETFESTDGKIGLDFQVNDQVLLYGSISTGFQAGGFQTLCFGSPVCAGTIYDPQEVINYEVGVKADLLDNRLRINANVFHAQYDDIQQTALSGGGFPQQNVGEVDVTGFELEVTAIPIDGLNLYATFGYADDEYEDLDPTSRAALVGATSLPSLPEYSAKVGFDYSFPVANGLKASFGADYFVTDDYFTESTNALEIDGYDRWNGFLSIGEEDGRWEFVLSGKNLADSDDLVSGIAGNGTNVRTVLPPREIMGTVKFKF